MRHAACRRALLDGILEPEVAEHLESCDRCRAFSRDLAQVSDYARMLEPPPIPSGLADAVVDRMNEALTGGAAERAGRAEAVERGTRPPRSLDDATDRHLPVLLRGTRRGPMLVTMSVAAVMLLLVGVLAVLPGTRGATPTDPTVDPLLAAARSTEETRTARFRVSGTVSVDVETPARARVFPQVELFEGIEPPPVPSLPDIPSLHFPTPDLSVVPEELRDEVARRFESFRQQAREHQEVVRDQIGETFERLRRGAEAALEGIRIPERFRFEADMSGEGSVVFGDRFRIDGTVDVVAAEPEVDFASGVFAVIVADRSTLVRGPDGTWLEIPGASGPLARLLADPRGVTALLENAAGLVDDAGETEIDGTPVRHYRFTIDPRAFATRGATVTSTADAWVGVDDGVLRRLTVSTTSDHEGPRGFRSTITSTMTVELFDFGTEIEVEVPEAEGRTSTPLGPTAVLAPHDDGFAAAFHLGVALSAPTPGVPPVPVPTFDDLEFDFDFDFDLRDRP